MMSELINHAIPQKKRRSRLLHSSRNSNVKPKMSQDSLEKSQESLDKARNQSARNRANDVLYRINESKIDQTVNSK